MKTVFIFGAGATRAAGERNSQKNLPPLDRDFFSISRMLNAKIHKRVADFLEKFLGEYSNTMCESLEAAASYLYLKAIDSKIGDDHHKAFLAMLDLINFVLGQNTNDLRVGPRSLLYRLFLNESKLVGSPNNISVLTFNTIS